jgi:hypothetical protein
MFSRDLLLRHQASHTNKAGNSKAGSDKQSERAIRACDACVLSKLKCGNVRPCKRCQERGIPCNTQSLSRRQTQQLELTEQFNNNPDPRQSGDGLRTPDSGASQPPQSAGGSIEQQVMPSAVTAYQPTDPQLFADPVAWPNPDFGAGAYDFPSFFEHIMDPDMSFGLSDSIQVPPALSTFMPTREWYNENDLFGLEFTPTLDQAIGTINYPFPTTDAQNPGLQPNESSDASQNVSRRHKIYQQSPWYVESFSKKIPLLMHI